MEKHYVADQHLLQSPPTMSGDWSEVYLASDVDEYRETSCDITAASGRELTRMVAKINELEKALRGVMEWIDDWDPNFTQDPDWPATKRAIDLALMVRSSNAKD